MMKDKYTKLNEILKRHNENEAYIFFSNILKNYSCILLPVYENETYNVKDDNFSRKMDINTSIEICYKFLKTFNDDIADRFLNIIRSTDENGPIVKFVPYQEGSESVVDRNGKVIINYKNDPSDVRTIIHELFHKINELRVDVDGMRYLPFANRFFTETVSILAEKLIAEYMFYEGYITDNDYKLLINKRIKNSKLAAKICIIENELINRSKNGEYIDALKLNEIRNNYLGNTSLEKIWEEKFNDNTIINNILANNNVTYTKTIEYAVAEYFSELISTRDDRYDILFELNDIISKTNIDFYDVSHNYLIKKLVK